MRIKKKICITCEREIVHFKHSVYCSEKCAEGMYRAYYFEGRLIIPKRITGRGIKSPPTTKPTKKKIYAKFDEQLKELEEIKDQTIVKAEFYKNLP